jgi:rhomboid protease GluP
MDLERMLFWCAVSWTAAFLAGLWRAGFGRSRGWAALCLAILAMAGARFLVPSSEATRPIEWIIIAAWASLLLTPVLLTHVANRLVLAQRYLAAGHFARLIRLLHPFDGWWIVPGVMDALALSQHGAPDEAAAALDRLLRDGRLPARQRAIVRAHIPPLTGTWEAFLATDDANDPAVAGMRIRALGETGRLAELVAAYRAIRSRGGVGYQMSRLTLFVFCGRPGAVAALLRGPLAMLDQQLKDLWLATARWAAGEPEAAAALAEFAGSADLPIRRSAERRLHVAPPQPQPSEKLSAADWATIAEAEAELARDAGYIRRPYQELRGAYVVIGCVLLNLAAFAGELAAGGSENLQTLYRLGALWPPAIVQGGEWWRLVTACFLHFGPVHLLFNMLALMLLGPWVEWAMGHWRTLLVYVGSAIGSMALVLLLIEQRVIGNQLAVGASGAIMGLVGAQAVLFGRGWNTMRSRLARGRLAGVVVIVVFQAAFDLSTPQVSFTAHASGFLIGVLLTVLVTRTRSREISPVPV